MGNSGSRWLFILACVLALAAVIQNFRFDSSSRQRQVAAQNVEREIGMLRVALAELRGGQASYLATGQGTAFWTQRVSDLGTQMDSGINRLRTGMEDPQALVQLATAGTALADLLSIDKRARQAIDSDQRFLAADIVFAEGLEPTQTLEAALSSAGGTEAATLSAQTLRESRIRLALMPAALLLVIVGGIVYGHVQRQTAPTSAAATMAQMLRELPPPVKPAPAVPTAAKPAAPAAPLLDLSEAAELCVDLARVMDVRDMPVLLGRAAKTLDASGVVVWVVTQEGDRLMPALSHGYSNRVIAKLGSLETSADNMTSVCYRTMKPQAMPGVSQPGATSAIAVPLMTTEGCHGVMSAELQVIKPPAETIALARIIAAQFATMTGPANATAEGARAAEA